MAQIKLQLPDGSSKAFDVGVTPLDVARSISEGLARQAAAAKVDGVLVDLTHKLDQDASLEIITFDSADGLEVYRHTTAHLMAHAVKDLYGSNVQVTIGPAIERILKK